MTLNLQLLNHNKMLYFIVLISLSLNMAGISQVVLGDLVFSKESSAREVAAVDNSEPEDECNDPYNCLPDTSEEAVPEEKVQFVKVNFH